MFNRTDREFILDMLLSCRRILEYTEGMDFDDFEKDDRTIDAVVRNIEILGEAVKNLTSKIKEKYPEVEWNEIARTRDKIIHFYFGTDPAIVWDIVTQDVPSLSRRLKDIIEREGWRDSI